MTTETTQTVVDDIKASAAPEAKVDDARKDGDDLDQILAQYEKETAKVETVSPPATDATPTDKVVPQTDPTVSRMANRIFQDDLKKAVTAIRGDLKVSDRVARGWLDEYAKEKPAIAQAFLEMNAGNPAKWERLQPALQKEFAREFKSDIDEGITEDRGAVTAFMTRGASTKAPAEAPANYAQASNQEFRNDVKAKYGFDPAV